jgi:hypothetical protein
MPPDDAPAAGENTYIGLAFSSDDSSFDIAEYDTKVEIQRNGATLRSATLTTSPESSRDGNTTMIFPEAGAYRIVASGVHRDTARAFTLAYNVRVSAPEGSKTATTSAGPDFWILSVGSLLLLTIIARYGMRQGKRYE